ncbi:MAG TPA: ATP-binding protein [Candidatus Hydrogenedentes bacterium]|nr:ATP-binding protein [Candidatus Hydrogenedentota bacterium]HPG68608.1 ATP-binding protein [Candidatus Hydrogenedentota bacterium]
MLELSLHILDLVENAIRAKASVIVVEIEEHERDDTLAIRVEDDGPGLPVSAEKAMDPFFTTKSGKKTGLGLSLFRAATEAAGGELRIGRSALGGVAVCAAMQLSHVDRAPLGDLAGTLAGMVCTNPEVEFRCRVATDGGTREASSATLPCAGGSVFSGARAFETAVRGLLEGTRC